MKLSRVRLLLVMLVILSLGWQVKPSEATDDACHRPELLYPYLEIDRYNKSYPYVDYKAVVNPVLDYMLERVSSVVESSHDIFVYWNEVCKANDPEKEDAAWRNLAYELNHRMHTDESIYKIAKILFGDEVGASLMNPPDALFSSVSRSAHRCFSRLGEIFVQHCGGAADGYSLKHVTTILAMCVVGVNEQEFSDAVSQTCKDYVYAPNSPFDRPSLTKSDTLSEMSGRKQDL